MVKVSKLGTSSIYKNKSEISFRGKNSNQILSICPEHKGIGLKSYSEGGLACVSYEAPQSWKKELGADIRSFLPYHAPNNSKGLMKIATFDNMEKFPESIDITRVRDVEADYVPRKNECFILMESFAENPPEGAPKDYPPHYKYHRLAPTDVKGEITILKEFDFDTEKLPYRIFKQIDATDEPKYFVHTKQVAMMPRCYGLGATYAPGQVAGEWWDLYYANMNKIVADAMPQLAEKEGFNPANIWMHDRPAFVLQDEIARRSARGESFYNGLKMHSTLHNPGHTYQGYYENPLGFLRVIFHEEDFEKLKKSPDYYELKAISKKPAEKLTQSEIARRDAILSKYFSSVTDDLGKPNITMMAVANTKLNSANSTIGTVSKNYGKEMKNHSGIAYGMTKALASVESIDVTNGNAPASLSLNKTTSIGRNGNGFSDKKAEYIRYSPVLSDDGKTVLNYDKKQLQTPEVVKKIQELKAKFEETEKPFNEYKPEVEVQKNSLMAFQRKVLKEIPNSDLTDEKLSKMPEDELNKLFKEQADKLPQEQKKYFEEAQSKLQPMEAKLAKLKAKRDAAKLNFDTLANMPTVKEAKEMNKKWILDLIGSNYDEETKKVNSDGLLKLFFNNGQITKDKMKVHGGLSKYAKGDKLLASWGRADEQKGFSTLVQGFQKFLQDPNVSDETKKHTKLLFGTAGVWKEGNAEAKIISDTMDAIRTMENGKYAGNVCCVEGFFPNKLIAGCDWGIFTSRYEPCGITPLESFASGTPVLSIRTGGAPDFIKGLGDKDVVKDEATGIMTKHPFMLDEGEIEEITGGKYNFEAIKKEISPNGVLDEAQEKLYASKLDEARRDILSDEVADMFKKGVSVDETTYDIMSQNASKQQIEWSKNAAFNGGKSANKIYMEEVFGLDEQGLKFKKPRVEAPMKKLTGTFGDTTNMKVVPHDNIVEQTVNQVAQNAKTQVKKTGLSILNFGKKLLKDKRTAWIAGAAIVVGGIATYGITRENAEHASQQGVKIGNSTVYFG